MEPTRVAYIACNFSFVHSSLLLSLFQTLRDSLDCMYDARIPTHWKKVRIGSETNENVFDGRVNFEHWLLLT